MNGPSANSLAQLGYRMIDRNSVAPNQIVERLLVSRLLCSELFNPTLRSRR